jgi:hypothetical protein
MEAIPVEIIPFSALPAAVLLFRKVPLSVRLCEDGLCEIAVGRSYCIAPTCRKISVGTSFVVQYQGRECEVRVGRRITVLDD